MLLFPALTAIIYQVSQVIAGCMGIAVFILMIRAFGFDSTRSSGGTTETLVGANFVAAILLPLVLTWPILGHETQYALPKFPTDFFLQSFWIIGLAILVGTLTVLIFRFRRFRVSYLWLPVMVLVAASWVAKTLGVMISVVQSTEINPFVKVLFGALDLVLGVVYLLAPGIAVVRFEKRYKKTPVPNRTLKA